MSCQARILDQEFTVPGTNESCHTTKECGRDFFKKISIDDGDSSMKICSKCFSRFMSKGSSKSTWYGWFDCDYPKEARIKYSAWWSLTVKKGEENQSLSSEEEEISNLMEKLVVSKKEIILQQLQAIDTWMKGEGKTKYKEQPAKIREAMKLRAQLHLI